MTLPKSIHQVGRGVFSRVIGADSLAGCTKAELRRHIESQFKPGMNWLNYGRWEIDHITPVTFFDLSNRDEYLACVHFSNLQPLWKRDNIRKSNRVGGKRIVPVNRKYESEAIDYEVAARDLRIGERIVLSDVENARRIQYSIMKRGLLAELKAGRDGRFRVRIVQPKKNRPKVPAYAFLKRKRNDVISIGAWEGEA